MWMPWRSRRMREQEERELEEELSAHLAIETRQRIERGQSADAAETGARLVLGNLGKIREETRETWGWTGMEAILNDIWYGWRVMRKAPVWTSVVALTLVLGIGLSTAIFSVVYGVMLNPLPYPEPGRLITLWNSAPGGVYQRFNANALNWTVWRARSHSFEDIALVRLIANYNLTGDGKPERLQAARTSWNLPHVLRVEPLMGRVFTEKEQNSDAHVAVLSYYLWQRRFGGDPNILGRKIPLNGAAYEVIGVMPANYRFPTPQFELWTPLYLPPDEIQPGLNYNYMAVGRLKTGVTVPQAQAEMSGIMRQFAQEHPQTNRLSKGKFVEAIVEPLLDGYTLPVRGALWVLLAAVGCLLLIGCFNLSILLLARASSRAKEIAVRAALGASGGRLRRQMLAEVIPLSILGAIGGIALAWLLLKSAVQLLPATMPRIESIGFNVPVLVFAIAISLLVVIVAALLPARVAGRTQMAGTMQHSSRSVAGRTRARSLLVTAQVAITVVLLFGGALFVRSLSAVLKVNPGFTTQGVLTMHLAVTRAKHPQDRQVAEFYERILERVRSLSGVVAAGFVNRLPLSGVSQTGGVNIEERPEMQSLDTDWRSATPGYFEAAGIPLKRGRLFSSYDRPDSPLVGLIDDQLAHKVFGDADPIGKRFRIAIADQPWVEIIGVVGHILNDTLEKDVRPQVYWPETQRTQDRAALVVRTMARPETLTAAVMEQIRKEDPDQPVYDVRSMQEWMSQTLSTRNLMTQVVTFFGAASLVLAVLGLYGVVSYTAGQRMREFGIRMALGAGLGHVRRLVLGQAGRLVVCGCALGLALAWPAGRALRSLLYGVTSSDGVAMIVAPVVLPVVALLASLGPARRATRADPASTLRAE